MKKLKRSICILVAFFCFIGCSATQKQETPIRVGINDDIVSLDPAGTKDVVSETLARCIFSTLFLFDEELNLVPCLAEKYEHTSDLEWIFWLRKDVKFQNGSLLTAEDVKFSIDRALNHEKGEKSLQVIDQLEVIDDHTLKVKTKENYINLPSLFVRVSTSVMSKAAIESDDYDWNKPVGSGPFRFKEHKEKEKISLERFDDYFLEPAKTKYLDFIVESSEQNRTAALLNGELDVLFRTSSYDGEYLKLNDAVEVFQNKSTKMELITFNPDFEPLDHLKVRQAIVHAINREALIDHVLDGYGTSLDSMIPYPLEGACDFAGFTYDIELSKQLLKEAGYEEGFDLSVLVFDMMRKKQMEYIKLDLAKVGIRLDYEFLELSDFLDKIEGNENMSSVMSWTSNADPDSTFSQIYSKNGHVTINPTRFSDPQVEEWLVKAKQEKDPQKRRILYEQANRKIAESYYIFPLYQADVLVAARKEIGGVSVNPQGIFHYEGLYRIEN